MNPLQPIDFNEATQLTLNRRDLLKLVGGGLVFGVFVPEASGALAKLPSAYLRIDVDGGVTILCSKVEYGQGVMTSLAQMAAEELDVPLASMRAVMGDTGQCPNDSDGGTYGSLTTRNFGPPLRTAAAAAKALLVQLASGQLGVPVDQLMTQDGYVINRNDPLVRISYADLAGGKSVSATLTTTPKTKDYTQFTISGNSAIRLDAAEKVTGQAKYTADVQLPGMLYARIVRPPARGATLTSLDTSAAEAMAGVRVVRVSNLVAVLHEKPDLAEQALNLVKAEYSLPQTGPDDTNIHQQLLSRPPAATLIGQQGSLVTGQNLAVTKIDQTYYTPYVAHAPIEPHAAVAQFEGSKLTVWASTQTPFALRTDLAGALAISSANIRVIPPYIGGAFGGKNYNQQAIEAARLARAVGLPVNLGWTRAEEFFYDNFQVPSIVKIRSGLDASGKITFWDYQVYFVESRGTTVFYNIPHYRLQALGTMTDVSRLPFAGGAWRAPGSSANTFARESHINSLAAAAQMDPVEFRLFNLKDARMRKVLQTAAASFGWPAAKTPSGRGLGVACGEDAGAYTVVMAQVEVNRRTGAIKVNRILCAQDMGRVINPDGARVQMEGCMMMGLGYALTEELHFSMGAITDQNFNRYHLPRFSWMPKLETVFVENNTLTPQGGGEPSIITVGAVLAGAVFDAIRVQPNQLPMTTARVLALIQQAPLILDPPQPVGDQIRLSWNGGPGIKLQKSATLINPTWQDVPNSEGQSSVTLPAADATAFFRLLKT